MKFEEFLTENEISLNDLIEGYETTGDRYRILAGLLVFLGTVFNEKDMLSRGLEALKSEELV